MIPEKWSKIFCGYPSGRMKALACSYVWWPGINDDLERTVRDYCTRFSYLSDLESSGVLVPLNILVPLQ